MIASKKAEKKILDIFTLKRWLQLENKTLIFSNCRRLHQHYFSRLVLSLCLMVKSFVICEFFISEQTAKTNLAEFVSQLKAAISNLKVVPTRGDSSYDKVHVSHHLSTCTHVFVTHDAI